MLKSLFFTMSIIVIAMPIAAESNDQSVGEFRDRVVGSSFSFSSKALGGERQIDIYLPDAYANSQEVYPVIYVMDSSFLFDLTVALLKNRWSRNLAPTSIIVGIQSRNNNERFTFAMPMMRDDGSLSFAESKPQLMARFFEKELTPYINDNYRTNDYKVLLGMSPTASNVMYDYLAKDPLFDAHIAIAADLHLKTSQGKPLHLSIEKKAKSTKDGFIFFSRASTDLSNNASFGIPYRYFTDRPESVGLGIHAILPSETEHYSVAAQSINQAFARLFPMSDWRPDYRLLRNSKDPVSYLDDFYQNLDKKVGFKTYPVVDGYWMGNNILGLTRRLGENNKLEQAAEVLIWANERLPDNLWINHFLSRVYTRMEEPTKALKFAKISVALANKSHDLDLLVFQENLKTLQKLLRDED